MARAQCQRAGIVEPGGEGSTALAGAADGKVSKQRRGGKVEIGGVVDGKRMIVGGFETFVSL